MRPSTVGGYQGPVTVLTEDNEVVADAACRYRAEEDAAGVDHWRGRLHRINPPDAVTAGSYRLRLADGQQGDITVGPVAPDGRFVSFEGIGRRPL